ncbi:MAG: hypothetical protein LBU43_00150, partial [Candidatus Accumulibacter sp.]|nr:hypothetical protein [Accumulibacter sp.]
GNRQADSATEVLEHLRNALEARDIDAIDAALANLKILPLNGEAHETVSEIAYLVLTMDFKKAVETVNTLLGRKEK